MRRQIDTTELLIARRQARKLAVSRRGSHPIAHLEPDKIHEWMRTECASLDAARQLREDKLMEVVIQTSSAALLAIPGLLVASGKELPTITGSWLLYSGLFAFALSFGCAFAEQILSSKAYRAQRAVAVKYFTQQSTESFDEKAAARADLARRVTLIVFAVAVSLGALGLFQVARGSNGRPADTSSAASSAASAASAAAAASASAASSAAAAASASASSAAAAAAAAASSGATALPGRLSPKVESGTDNSASTKAR